ncbi:hypothetical protein [Klebsiella pneumoniae]|uniref:hypothetical protein n=1 Tax=Klebsiella pneumoniae TaxID=573 RepID=UPI002731AD08|nr:hypothetical protein [Klebsiella pneumoniae]MDP1129365.1 hypothetical protein [Klebsiella pneumoniae]MDP1490308.1 hypothetical protein [Klebsiella pneumoniae]
MSELLTYANTLVLAALLIAGGWVKIRDYFRNKATEKAKAKSEEIEALVQARLKKLQSEAGSADQTAATVSGDGDTTPAA